MVPHITTQILREAVVGLSKDTFDTHEVEQWVLRNRPMEFARDLLTFEGKQDAFRLFSAWFSTRIRDDLADTVERASGDRPPSLNMGGRPSGNQQWRVIRSASRP